MAKAGRRLDVSLTISPIRDQDGQIIGASKIARDISERKRSERALAEQREWQRVTLSSIGDAVITTDRQGMVTFLNPVAETLTGFAAAEARGRPLAEVFNIINEDTRQAAENPGDKVMRTGHIVGVANHTALIARDGRERRSRTAPRPSWMMTATSWGWCWCSTTSANAVDWNANARAANGSANDCWRASAPRGPRRNTPPG